MNSTHSPDPASNVRHIASHCGGKGKRPALVLSALALLGLVAAMAHAALLTDGYRRFMFAYLVAFAFVLSLSLGAMFFLLMQHLTRAGWSVLVRRPAEAMAANMLVIAVLFVPIAVCVLRGGGEIYPWARTPAPPSHVQSHQADAPVHVTTVSAHEPSAAKPTIQPLASGRQAHDDHAHVHIAPGKRAFLNPGFFIIRWVCLLSIWSVIGWCYWRCSIHQDRTRDIQATVRMEKWAGFATLVFGLTLTLGAFDLLMSLDPHWYSTIFGVYYFGGSVVAGLSVMILMILAAQRAGFLTRAVTEAHYLDLGRLLFAFVFFWGYIAFSQYMLLWYANLPETTHWLRRRGASTAAGEANDWSWVLIVLLLGHFVLPMAGLMSRHIKKRAAWMTFWAIWLLVMHYLDLYWIVMPELGPKAQFGLVEVGLWLSLVAIFLLTVRARLERHSLVPLGDPRVPDSVLHESVY